MSRRQAGDVVGGPAGWKFGVSPESNREPRAAFEQGAHSLIDLKQNRAFRNFKNPIIEIKKSEDELNSRLDTAKDRASELEDKSEKKKLPLLEYR